MDLESGALFTRIRKFTPQAVPLFVYAIRHTSLLAMASESKGFSPESKRCFYYELRMRKAVYTVLASLFGILVILIYVRLGLGFGVVLPGRMQFG